MCNEEQNSTADSADLLRAIMVTARQKQQLMTVLFPTMASHTVKQAAAAMALEAVLAQYPPSALQQFLQSFSDGDEQLAISRVAHLLAIADELPLTSPL